MPVTHKNKATPAALNYCQTLELLTDEGVCVYLATNTRTLRLWRHTLGLPFIRLTAKTLRYRKADLDAWLARRRVAIAA